ncbi:fatty acid transporter [Macrophomina phaseolina]|uniref:Fatty acid transporter n=1 Tax=Macrophomina phaseolina TaxID=35725 RepID=A0ABQ8G019_9PEZI|nr:fatty acid transporter [Macrophomina phaseolina]
MSALPFAAAAAGAASVAAYLNAKFHLAHDLRNELTLPIAMVYAAVRLRKNRLLSYHILEEQAERQPDHPWLVYDAAGGPERRRDWTYAQFLSDVRKAANWLKDHLGVKVGEVVALDGPNTPEYMIFWFALDALGAVPSFINCNLTSKALIHCVTLCECRYLLCDTETKPLVEPDEDELKTSGVRTIYYSPTLLTTLTDDTPIPASLTSTIKPTDLRSLIYTSGTTGLPKATQISTIRDLVFSYNVVRALSLTPSTRMYTCMPLYHIAAHTLCTFSVLHAGGTVVLGKRFSHASFWPEVVAGEATVIQYVGELCRYLMNAPPGPLDRAHRVKMAWGNGMRPDIWEGFRERFGIETIAELYGATDGLTSGINLNKGDFTRFAVALRGGLWRLKNRNLAAIVKVDKESGDEILRGKDGWAIKCADGEPGELLTRMDRRQPNDGFAGYYRNASAGNKRKVENVFEEGDLWFRSGDMLRLDSEGRLYFVDRMGDTFRWKAENVSTTEVSDVIGAHPHVAEANVYGIAVPHTEGRCGGAAITFANGVTEESFDFEGLARHAIKSLPRYAVPIFLRITPKIDYTGTLKMQKVRLRDEGMNVELVEKSGDRLYWLPTGGDRYVPFTVEDYRKIQDAKLKL